MRTVPKMGDVVAFDVIRSKLPKGSEEVWQAYLTARDRAEKSRDIRDGIEAGKAWAAWLKHVGIEL